ncbi:MAG: hypothetical protein R3E90_01990 [Marinicella sp.]|nr:hypothetical protein [Xanthomonadales bacterium]
MNKLMCTLLVLMILPGCKKSEDLETSVNNRWQAVVENDLEKAYEYFSPGYKKIENLLSYRNRIATAKINMNWTSGKYKSAQCETDSDTDTVSTCKVQVQVAYTYTFPRRSMGTVGTESVVVEDWIQVKGKWYLVPKER